MDAQSDIEGNFRVRNLAFLSSTPRFSRRLCQLDRSRDRDSMAVTVSSPSAHQQHRRRRRTPFHPPRTCTRARASDSARGAVPEAALNPRSGLNSFSCTCSPPLFCHLPVTEELIKPILGAFFEAVPSLPVLEDIHAGDLFAWSAAAPLVKQVDFRLARQLAAGGPATGIPSTPDTSLLSPAAARESCA